MSGAVILLAPPITAVRRYSCFTRDQRVVLRTVVLSVGSCSKRRGCRCRWWIYRKRVGAIEIAGIDLTGGRAAYFGEGAGTARQADGGDPAIRGVILPDVEIVQIQTGGRIEAEGRRSNAVALVLNLIPAGVVGFSPIRLRRNAALSPKLPVKVKGTPTRPAPPMLADPSIPESKARLLADHIDRAGGALRP